jgi:hypothetical protein
MIVWFFQKNMETLQVFIKSEDYEKEDTEAHFKSEK